MKPARVVLIGPECTGKTWLTGELASHFAVPFSPEHARAYVESRSAPLGYADVDAIARGQQAVEDDAIARADALGAPLVLLDTDLVSTMIYSRHYYGDCPAWIEEAAVRRLAELYLLHEVDVEWRSDGLQREQPERREELFVRFKLTLDLLGATTAAIAGAWDERRRRALEAIDGLLASPR